ncbi:MAG: AAA family ATPase [Gammaproteobacteria bacterium]|nr:AAA family ATPase [Gammaproteobacteria bacterium]
MSNSTSIRRSSSYTTTLDEKDLIGALNGALNSILLGKEVQVNLALACLIARGHLLIEDLPGMGKTLLSHALARVLGLSYNRIQFTSDVLPADVIGTSVFDRTTSDFRFIEGPLFAQVVLADEINRATPKSQSALLEAMEERQVTVEGQTLELPQPFIVIATQNPVTQTGTFPLPESQLDRFLMRIELGYPEPDAERELLRGGDRRQVLESLESVADPDALRRLQAAADEVKVSDPLIDYVQRLVSYSRREAEFAFGLSPRGALAMLQSARAWALLHGRSHVVPEDVQAVLPSVVEHRLREAADFAGHGGGALAQKLLSSVDVVG